MYLILSLLINVSFFAAMFSTATPTTHETRSRPPTSPLTIQTVKIACLAEASDGTERYAVISNPLTPDISPVSLENQIRIQAIANEEITKFFIDKNISWIFYKNGARSLVVARCTPSVPADDKTFTNYMQIFIPVFITNCFNKCLSSDIKESSESLMFFCTHAVLKALTALHDKLDEDEAA